MTLATGSGFWPESWAMRDDFAGRFAAADLDLALATGGHGPVDAVTRA